MPIPVDLIAAGTHPAEYLCHKYWARKPHNVLRHFVSTLLDDSDVFLDPFCGSGVALREAALLGHDCFGFDLNPIAARLSSLTTTSISEAAFVSLADSLLAAVDEASAAAYGYDDGSSGRVRYIVHETVSLCGSCGTEIGASEASKVGRTYRCPRCAERVRFNLEGLRGTRVLEVAIEGQTEPVVDREHLAQQAALARSSIGNTGSRYDFPFVHNPRTLSYRGLRTSHLFTRRNFSLLSFAADLAHSIPDRDLRNAVLLMLTGSVAQCSRLIPFRARLTGGGPAWSVPGFWVPPIHLETNPSVHLRARFKRFRAAFIAMQRRRPHRTPVVECLDAAEGLERLYKSGVRAGLVYLDPPYGDSVPYFEFSALWNSFLRERPSYDRDLSVSDRLDAPRDWAAYSSKLAAVVEAATRVLHSNGKLLITFNNNDYRAWAALLAALQASELRCSHVHYQIPAVVSAKAQFAPETSYVSDLYAVYEPARGLTPNDDVTAIIDALMRCASSREGRVAPNLVRRTAAVAWMSSNAVADRFEEVPRMIDELFVAEDRMLRWSGELDSDVPRLTAVAEDVADDLLAVGPLDWTDLYRSIAERMVEFGVPDPGEVRSILSGTVTIRGGQCFRTSVTRQPTLL